jgi:hypothetical protein
MITATETLILNIIRHHLLGKQLPSNFGGDAGRACEDLLEDIVGITINRGQGCDIPEIGWEVKCRKGTATSAQTVAMMRPENIIVTPYRLSPVYEKIQKQLRFTTNDLDVIIAIDLCDFDQPQIQDLLEAAYENARKLLTKNINLEYTPYEGYWGYFEKTRKDRPELDFRLADGDMEGLLAMTHSNFQNIFDYGVSK